MSGYVADLGLLDFESELGAAPTKKKKKKKVGAKLKGAFKKIGKGIAVVSTGGIALAGMKKGKALLSKAKKSRAGKSLLGAGKKLGLQAKKKLVTKAKTMVKARVAGASPKAARVIGHVASRNASDCGSKSDLAKLVTAQLTAQLAPRLNEANELLAKFDLQRSATNEHRRLMSESGFRREVLSLLALQAANGNKSCQKAVRVIMAGRG